MTERREGVLCNAGTVGEGTDLRFETPDQEADVLVRLAALRPVRPGAVVGTEILGARPP